MTDYRRSASHIFVSHYDHERPFDWQKEFQGRGPLHVEIGFGQGEFLLRCVQDFPGVNHVGIELDWNRIRKCFKSVSRSSEDVRMTMESRLKILQVDAWVALERLFDQRSIAHIECLFPCPWPKDCHEKHRLFSNDFLCLLNSRLIDQGDVHLVTDYHPFVQWVHAQVPGCGFQVTQQRIPAQFGTKFEKKWHSGGQEEFFELTFRKEQHVDRIVKEDSDVKAYYHDNFFPERFAFQENISEGIAVVFKERLYDPEQQKGMVRVLVSEEHLTQYVWIVIVRTQKGWGVFRAEGQHVLPTPGVARALELISQAVEATASAG